MLCKGAFQFRKGAIKSYKTRTNQHHRRRFNSEKVRLRAVIGVVVSKYFGVFQFRKGAIKRVQILACLKYVKEFQFRKGAIKRCCQ